MMSAKQYKQLAVIFILFCTFPATHSHAAHHFSTDGWNLLTQTPNIHYTLFTTRRQALSISTLSWSHSVGTLQSTASGFGLTYHYYLNQQFKGHYYAIGYQGGTLNLTQQPIQKTSFIHAPFYEYGYSFLVSRAMSIHVGIRALVIMSQVDTIQLPYIGLHFQPTFQIGWIL